MCSIEHALSMVDETANKGSQRVHSHRPENASYQSNVSLGMGISSSNLDSLVARVENAVHGADAEACEASADARRGLLANRAGDSLILAEMSIASQEYLCRYGLLPAAKYGLLPAAKHDTKPRPQAPLYKPSPLALYEADERILDTTELNKLRSQF